MTDAATKTAEERARLGCSHCEGEPEPGWIEVTNNGPVVPCPFCGASAEMEPWHGGTPTKQLISCSSDVCNAMPSVTGETPDEATERWNQRASDLPPGIYTVSEDGTARRLEVDVIRFVKSIVEMSLDDCGVDWADIQDLAVKCGILTEVEFNPEKHDDPFWGSEPGDPWLVFSDGFRALTENERHD